MADGDTSRSLTPPGPRGWLGTLGWAGYLACSWTWCIGMFLPVLLVRDYGVWGFVVFAVPNVVGAAAMGWVLAKSDLAERVRERHRLAALIFSVVTSVFQAFFLLWILRATSQVYDSNPALVRGSGSWQIAGLIINGVIMCAILAVARRGRGALILALVLWVASFAVLGYFWAEGQFDAAGILQQVPTSGVRDLAFLAPVCLFGFALCPYLDLTFLKAASEQTQAANRTSFTLGFGALFFAMILFTLGYGWMFLRVVDPATFGLATPPALLHLVILHMLAQLVFTIWVHAREIGNRHLFSAGERRKASAIAIITGCAIGLLVVLNLVPTYAGLVGGELIYRLFMSFYGLIFPAYVYLCMIPTRDGHSGITGPEGKRKLRVLAGAIAIAAPMFWLGFIERQTSWLVPGLAVVLVSRVLVMGARRRINGGAADSVR